MSRTRRTFRAIAASLTGFSTPIFGVSWQPPKQDRETIRRLINALEDRRALYVPENLEVTGEVEQSVLRIREELTRSLQDLPEDSPAVPHVRAMRAACRKFLDQPRPNYRNLHQARWRDVEEFGAGFFVALGELRSTFGTRVGALAVAYGIDVEEELAAIFPPDPEPGS